MYGGQEDQRITKKGKIGGFSVSTHSQRVARCYGHDRILPTEVLKGCCTNKRSSRNSLALDRMRAAEALTVLVRRAQVTFNFEIERRERRSTARAGSIAQFCNDSCDLGNQSFLTSVGRRCRQFRIEFKFWLSRAGGSAAFRS